MSQCKPANLALQETKQQCGLVSKPSGKTIEAEFSYERMEEELTCPVCLELYADPLMLPCSHSVCKKCLQDIISSHNKANLQGVECPSCRAAVQIQEFKVDNLPRNLALENVVIRYTEERSKSIRQSLSRDSPVGDSSMSPSAAVDLCELPEFPVASAVGCELCDGSVAAKAAWHCLQCQVSYCHACFAKYHPRRGALARHKLRQPQQAQVAEQLVYCDDHHTEVATIFCDDCKLFVCHLCVCEGEGQHIQHKVLAPDTAAKLVKEVVEKTKEEANSLLRQCSEQKGKLTSLTTQLQELHEESKEQVEQQFQLVLSDLKHALQLEKQQVLNELQQSWTESQTRSNSVLEQVSKHSEELATLSSSCQQLAGHQATKTMLSEAAQLQPLLTQLETYKTQADDVQKSCDAVLMDTKTRKEMQSETQRFYKKAADILAALLEAEKENYESVIPHVSTSASTDLSPRTHSRCIITWGFSSSSFTGEQLSQCCCWTVAIESNHGHLGDVKTGYLFGIGVSSDQMPVRDQVGMSDKSHGLVCLGGCIYFAHNGKQEHIMAVDSLPLTVTVSVYSKHPLYTILTYSIACTFTDTQDMSLKGIKVIWDSQLKRSLYPVFTVSQRVKLLFPTCV